MVAFLKYQQYIVWIGQGFLIPTVGLNGFQGLISFVSYCSWLCWSFSKLSWTCKISAWHELWLPILRSNFYCSNSLLYVLYGFEPIISMGLKQFFQWVWGNFLKGFEFLGITSIWRVLFIPWRCPRRVSVLPLGLTF